MRATLLLICCALFAHPALAADAPRYGAWEQDGDRTQDLVQELQRLVDEAERARAADPRLLRDLRELAGRYGRPWRVELLRDDFRDGDFTHDPAWVVVEGHFTADDHSGLHSTAQPADAAPAQDEQRSDTLEDALFGAIMKKIERKVDKQDNAEPADSGRAAIRSAVPITNAFAVRIELTAHKLQGRFEFGPHPADDQGSGYRLAYMPGQRPALELLRASGRSTAVIEVYDQPANIEKDRSHLVEWTRHPNGDMAVALDGNELFRVTDRRFRDAFAGFIMVNYGGEFLVRELSVRGTHSVTPQTAPR